MNATTQVLDHADPAHARARGAMVERMMDWYEKTRMQR